MIDPQLPPGWQGSYGTLNTRHALIEIHARLCALENSRAAEYIDTDENIAAVHISVHPYGIESAHVVVNHTRLLGYEEALRWLRAGLPNAYVEPGCAGLVLDALEEWRNADPRT